MSEAFWLDDGVLKRERRVWRRDEAGQKRLEWTREWMRMQNDAVEWGKLWWRPK